MKKRKDECLICTSRKCNHRIFSKDGAFDEIACPKHAANLKKQAEPYAVKLRLIYYESTGTVKRDLLPTPFWYRMSELDVEHIIWVALENQDDYFLSFGWQKMYHEMKMFVTSEECGYEDY